MTFLYMIGPINVVAYVITLIKNSKHVWTAEKSTCHLDESETRNIGKEVEKKKKKKKKGETKMMMKMSMMRTARGCVHYSPVARRKSKSIARKHSPMMRELSIMRRDLKN